MLVRLLFLAAWICPTVALIGGGLPASRIVASVGAAGLSGALLCILPWRAFRIARVITAALLPLSWLWIGYVTLNGMGPTAIDAAGALANTNPSETLTALRLLCNSESIGLGLTQSLLLAASYVLPPARELRHSRAALAILLSLLMLDGWIPRLLASTPAFLPGRDDWQNFPYGSAADVVSALVDNPSLLRPPISHRSPVVDEAHVADAIDAIFVVGESFRYERQWQAGDPQAWSALNGRLRAGLGVVLPKVCASADATMRSVPMLVTGTSPAHSADAATAPSGLTRLAAAGYATAWISNQTDAFFNDEHRDLVWLAKGYANQYDDALLPIATEFLARKDARNKALVLHLMDSHAAYIDRYPAMAEPVGLGVERQELLEYHRANDHTGRFLGKIAALIDTLPIPAFAVYVSDHGENLLSDHNGIHYHIGARTTAEAGYVPSFVFWNSAFLRAFHPIDRLRRMLAAPSLAHADVYKIWMNFAGLGIELSPTLDPQILGKIRLTDQVGAVPCSRLGR
ncbi:MAG TPA: sulfatase-like hydrolase/transferase [Steroidobacteraceae bacterium]|nr:sulfatase-like hydrolase/transferase [Steroidobacteraceae bacterium]